MRIRKSSPNSPSCSSSSSSYSFSSLTNNSLASSTDSSSSAPSSISTSASSPLTRCQGLDLLVKAIHLVTAGSVVGVPYIQRRVVTRRRRRVLCFESLCFNKDDDELKCKVPRPQRRRLKTVPAKYQDSVLVQPKSRRVQRSAKACLKLGS